ncbi:unnamed protein product [Acanthoscelides obtectus]|uniref:Protein with SprT-like domain at the N terminus n=1 Tax=Acanthoscelides obtectus TaxID=200917 RepID=A0A9P0KSN7_ACAOB|nr:unnamed protein product [Acanthoscelides obtectus]CAK1657783.1 SprT-like domain-containing protein Spartan [Acanthoscelides obtectus]
MQVSRRWLTLLDPETFCPLRTKRNYPSTSLTHPKWELLDPTPNIQNLFKEFNKKYFCGKIKGVTVVWGKLLDEAGVTIFRERDGRKDYDCRIVLSAPLLRLRPRSDLINTLLHEMIHAFLFVTFNKRDRAEHGTEFKKHMRRLNTAAGTAITIYHEFHDEVDLYTKQHWWRCNGPCQTWRPNFGLVRKMRNKPPGSQDRWWATHTRKCGGTFIKVRQPGDMDAKPVKMATKGKKAVKKGPQPRGSKRRAGCSLETAIVGKRSRSISPCPACDEIVDMHFINEHLDECLKKGQPKDCIVCSEPFPREEYEEHVISCVDKKFNDVQFKECLICSCKILLKDFERHLAKCSDHHQSSFVDDCINTHKYCATCDSSIVVLDYDRHVETCGQAEESPTDENISYCEVCKEIISEENYNDHVENCVPRLFEQNDGKTNCIVCGMCILMEELNLHLEECDGLVEIVENEADSDEEEENLVGELCACPICIKLFLYEDIYKHIDECIVK